MTTRKALRTNFLLAISVSLLIGSMNTSSAVADFGLIPGSFDGGTYSAERTAYTQGGGHPYEVSTTFDLNTVSAPPNLFGATQLPDGAVRSASVAFPPGLIGDPNVVPQCSGFADLIGSEENDFANTCPVSSQIGISYVRTPVNSFVQAVYNMKPPPGTPAAFAFRVVGTPVLLTAQLRSDGDYGVTVRSDDISQGVAVLGVKVTLWGVPADPSHDGQRCQMLSGAALCDGEPGASNPPHSAGIQPMPFITTPTRCNPPGMGDETRIRIVPWDPTRLPAEDSFFSHLAPGFPLPPEQWGAQQGMTGCELIPFDPNISIKPTTDEAETPTGLDVELSLPQNQNPDGLAQANLKKAVVALPNGMTVNPAIAEGLGVCSPADLARETATSNPGAGCPNNSKLGTITIETSALEEPLRGNLYQAKQDDPRTSAPGAENPFDSLIALYIVAKQSERGVLVKLSGKVEPDPNTGQLITTFDDNPQLPFDKFTLSFREGARAPLVSPPACGTYSSEASFIPWSAANPDNPKPSEVVHDTSSFQITQGVGGGPCPAAGIPPFRPGFSAGSINNNAGSYTPFNMRLIRNDGEQNMTKFSSVLPPGVVGKLAGLSKCSDAAVAIAKSKRGREEIASPSCPASSQIGRILAGAGVGSVLTYVPGKVYLGGPYNGAPLSVIVVTPAVAGPFDVGTVVVREALALDPKTAEVQVDGAASDPIPHILQGIPLKLRDLRVYVDRENFILNPTSCDSSSVRATLFGSYLDLFSSADDVPVDLASRFQAANCANLGFKPKLSLKLAGGTKRGGHPGLTATYKPRPGDTNVSGLVVRLPRSAFLDQAHIRTICTRVQFAVDACPPAAQYGYIKAFTPLLDEPLQGPVWLRSSNNKLPDLVFDLKGIVDVEVATRIDSVRGGIRATVESAPDAPLSKVIVTMQGGKKGLIVNSTNLCKGTNRGETTFAGHNGKSYEARPVVKPVGCRKARKGKR